MAAGLMSKERRESPRASEHVPVAISDDSLAIQTETKNISAAGAYCTLDRFIAPMTKLKLQFDIPAGSRRRKIRCSGVVVRVEPVVANVERGLYNVAIFFTELSDRDRLVLTRFVRQRLSAQPSTN